MDSLEGRERRKPGPRPISTDRLLDSACRVFATRGYEAASMSELAAAAEITRVTLYRYFRDKSTILAACLDREAKIARSHLFAEYDRGSRLTVREEIAVDMEALYDYAARRPDGFRLLLDDTIAGPGAEHRNHLGDAVIARLAQQMSKRSGIDADEASIRQLARMTVGVAVYGSRGADSASTEDQRSAARLATAFVIGGLAAVSNVPID